MSSTHLTAARYSQPTLTHSNTRLTLDEISLLKMREGSNVLSYCACRTRTVLMRSSQTVGLVTEGERELMIHICVWPLVIAGV